MRVPVSSVQALWAIVTIALITDSARGVEPLKPANRPAAENPSGKYAEVNGLRIYYEVHGAGGIPWSCFMVVDPRSTPRLADVLPRLAKTRRVIALEERGHGRTADIVDRPFRFEDSADDAAALLRHLKIERADFFGFSNGGNIALQIAIRHPAAAVDKLVVGSTMSKRDGIYPEVWEFIKRSSPKDMPKALQEEYLRLAPNPGQLSTFHDKCVRTRAELQGLAGRRPPGDPGTDPGDHWRFRQHSSRRMRWRCSVPFPTLNSRCCPAATALLSAK